MSKSILLALFLIGIVLSIVYFLNSGINPSVVSYDHPITNVTQNKGGVRGEFIAPNNYLGLLTLRFDNKDIIEKKSIFRIKEKNGAGWYHTSFIDTVQYNIKPLYTFGLPVIVDSKGKTYQFEVVILDFAQGEPTLELSKKTPVITSQYVFPLKVFLKDQNVLFNFLSQKIAYQLQNPHAFCVFFSYLLPLIGYLLYIGILKKYIPLHFNLKPIISISLFGIGFDIFILRNNYDMIALLLSLAWICVVIIHKIKPQTSILIALLLTIWCPFFLIAHMEWVAEKSANWMFIFSVIGIIQFSKFPNIIWRLIGYSRIPYRKED